MNSEIIATYRQIADTGKQGQKSDAIRALCDEIEAGQRRRTKRAAFVPPLTEEIRAYARERKVNKLSDCEDFLDHYTANGWKVGRVPMVDWKAAFRRWTSRNQLPPGNGNGAKSIGGRYGVA